MTATYIALLHFFSVVWKCEAFNVCSKDLDNCRLRYSSEKNPEGEIRRHLWQKTSSRVQKALFWNERHCRLKSSFLVLLHVGESVWLWKSHCSNKQGPLFRKCRIWFTVIPRILNQHFQVLLFRAVAESRKKEAANHKFWSLQCFIVFQTLIYAFLCPIQWTSCDSQWLFCGSHRCCETNDKRFQTFPAALDLAIRPRNKSCYSQ